MSLLIIAGLLAALIYSLTWRPADKETLPVSCVAPRAPTLLPGQALKVMTWNVQYLAGKNYVFWYDIPDGSGPDDRPTVEDMAFSLDEVARVIRDEQPDILLLQEVDEGAKPSHYQDQLALLQERLVDLYPCSTQAFDWKADFVPSLPIFGSVGRKLATLSRYQIEHARTPATTNRRCQLHQPSVPTQAGPAADVSALERRRPTGSAQHPPGRRCAWAQCRAGASHEYGKTAG